VASDAFLIHVHFLNISSVFFEIIHPFQFLFFTRRYFKFLKFISGTCFR